MADIIDLRDLEGHELEVWRKAIEDQTGYDFESLKENSSEMIAESYFEEYAQELAEDVGATKGTEWPFTCIDWEEASEKLKQDYSTVEVEGETYYFRSY